MPNFMQKKLSDPAVFKENFDVKLKKAKKNKKLHVNIKSKNL
jgi:hypothetical protein